MELAESPAGARRRVRQAIRRARDEAGYTQGQVAEAMEWSLSKVMRIENGDVTVQPNDLRPLLSYLGIRDKATVDELVRAAKTSKQRAWWDAPRFRDAMTPAMKQLVQLEQAATSMRYFLSLLIPGRLQTDDYARAVLAPYAGELTEEEIAVRLDVRRRRREAFASRTDGQAMHILLDESVLLRQMGSDQIVGEQLLALLKLIDEGRLVVRIQPFKTHARIPWLGAFELLYLGSDLPENAVLYRESDLSDEIVDDDIEKLSRHRAIFDRSWAAVPDEAAARRLIEDRAAELVAPH